MSFYTQFTQHYEAIFPFSETVYTFLRRYIPPGWRCLDVGCGTGHYTGRLADDGCKSTGIDLDAAMVAHAQTHYPQAIFHTMNMLDIADLLFPTPFQTIFCIGNTAAHLTQAQFATFLDAVRRTLAPGGTWILQVMNWDFVLTQPSFTFPVITANNDIIFRREYRDISEQHVTFHTRLQAGDSGISRDAGTIFEDSVPLYPLRSSRIIEMHEKAGFTCTGHFGNYAGSSFDPGKFSANIYVFRK